jgi:hypothetical protein
MKLLVILMIMLASCTAPQFIQRNETIVTLTHVRELPRGNKNIVWLTWESLDGMIVIVSEAPAGSNYKVGDTRVAFVK